jgi:protein-S-isoprenylcysteine O-methyltransferase Ste14
MSTQISPKAERHMRLAIDLGERLFVLLLFASLVVRLSHSLIFRPYNLLVLISEGLVAVLIVLRRNTETVTMRPLDWVIALAGTAIPMLLQAGGKPPLPPAVGTVLMCGGLSFAIWAKATLRQSFGIAAANRGAVNSGPYRLIRHPIYAGYILVYVGYSLNNPLAWNVGVYAVTIALQIMRILAEERVLGCDPEYGRYQSIVRYRLLPGVF